MKKKILFFALLPLVTLLLSLPSKAITGGEAHLSGKDRVLPLEEVTVTVTVAEGDPVLAAMLEPIYDKTAFDLIDFTFLREGKITDFNGTDGVILWEEPTSPNGALASFTLRVKEEAKIDTYNANCKYTVIDENDVRHECESTALAIAVVTHNYSVRDYNETEHWMKCSECGAIDESTRGAHTYDNACDADCNECGFERTPADHVYDDDRDLTCNECGFEREAPYVLGDLDQNGTVDSADAIYLLYHTLFGEARYPVNQPVDYNKDGLVDSGDAIYLLYYILFGSSRYPL